MEGISEQTLDICNLYTIKKQSTDPKTDLYICNYCRSTVCIGRDTKKLNAHIVMHFFQFGTVLNKSNVPNVSEIAVSSESAVSRLNYSSNMGEGSQISMSRQSGAENTQSGNGESQGKRMQSLLAEIMTNLRGVVNSLNDIICSFESELNSENSKNE